jgi:hypothetical protein
MIVPYSIGCDGNCRNQELLGRAKKKIRVFDATMAVDVLVITAATVRAARSGCDVSDVHPLGEEESTTG